MNELTQQEKQFIVAIFKELKFSVEAAENAMFAKQIMIKLSQPEAKAEEKKKEGDK